MITIKTFSFSSQRTTPERLYDPNTLNLDYITDVEVKSIDIGTGILSQLYQAACDEGYSLYDRSTKTLMCYKITNNNVDTKVSMLLSEDLLYNRIYAPMLIAEKIIEYARQNNYRLSLSEETFIDIHS